MKAILSACLLCSASVAAAGETTRYGYDAQGKLQVTDVRRSDGTGYAAGYGYDKAGNRTVFQNANATRLSTLPPGASLAVGEGIVSASGNYRFTLQYDGNLVLYAGPQQPLWATYIFRPANASLIMQDDGNLVLYSGSQPLWASNTEGNPGAWFIVQDDGNIVVYSASGRALWARF